MDRRAVVRVHVGFDIGVLLWLLLKALYKIDVLGAYQKY